MFCQQALFTSDGNLVFEVDEDEAEADADADDEAEAEADVDDGRSNVADLGPKTVNRIRSKMDEDGQTFNPRSNSRVRKITPFGL